MNSTELIFSHKLFNPLFWHVRDAIRNEDIRYIFERGGSSSGKTVSTVQAILLSVLNGEGSAVIFRKVGASIKNTIYEEFKVQARRLHIYNYFNFIENNISCYNGLKIDFSGLDNPEKIKGITNYKWVILEEVSDFDYIDFTQITFRLRGKRGLQVICLFNPISEEHWIKKKVFDAQGWDEKPTNLCGRIKNPVTGEILNKEYSSITGVRMNKPRNIFNERTGKYEIYAPDTIELLSTYKNNFWVVGSPCGTYGYYDKQTIANYEWYRLNDYNYYRIYALGEWGSIKTGGEFLHAFDAGKHKGKFPYISGIPMHISIDDNLLPYISVSVWQCIGSDNKMILRQVHEICAEDPFNTVTKAAELVRNWLNDINYQDVVFMYGDASTKKGSNMDEEKRSFKDKFKETLESEYVVVERMPRSNPSVSMSGEFVNAILSGVIKSCSIEINETCSKSVYDYENAKKDVNGGILKKRIKDKLTGQSYEQFGHLTDTMRYFVCKIMEKEYNMFSLRRKHNSSQEDDIRYYDASKLKKDNLECLIEINPSVNGKYVAVKAYLGNDNKIYIDDAILMDGMPQCGYITSFIDSCQSVQMETPKEMMYYLKELRDITDVSIFGRPDRPYKCERIDAHIDFIKANFYFPHSDTLALFIDNILDYNGKDNFEALNSLACICERIKRSQS